MTYLFYWCCVECWTKCGGAKSWNFIKNLPRINYKKIFSRDKKIFLGEKSFRDKKVKVLGKKEFRDKKVKVLGKKESRDKRDFSRENKDFSREKSTCQICSFLTQIFGGTQISSFLPKLLKSILFNISWQKSVLERRVSWHARFINCFVIIF